MPERRGGSAALILERRGDGIAVIVWDERAAPEGSRDAAHIEGDLDAHLDELARWPALRGLVVVCVGGGAGVAEAWLRELRGLRSAAECVVLARRTQALATRFARLPVPSVAALQGPCRGRALAFALAADARIASGDEGTFFAAPEVRLGLVPSGGTTLRLPRLIGIGAALDLMLSDREVPAAAALRLGLVDRLATRERLLEDGVALARSLPGASRPKRRNALTSTSRAFQEAILARNPFGRALLMRRVRRRALARIRSNYPAPERLLEVVCGGLSRGFEAGHDLEAQAFGDLAVSTESRALLRLFAARDELAGASEGEGETTEAILEGGPSRRRGTRFAAIRAPESPLRVVSALESPTHVIPAEAGIHVRQPILVVPAELVPDPDRGAGTREQPVVASAARVRPINAVGIVGAGPTGAGIAYVSAKHAGVEVRLAGGSAAARDQGVARLRAVLDAQVESGRLGRACRDAVLRRVRPVAGREALAGVDLVMDAEPGSLDDKRRTIADLEGLGNEHLIYASGLVAHPIARLASTCRHPGNVVGMRYSPPVERMPLLEVVAGEQSAPRAVAACVDFGRRQGKTVIVVRDCPGFYCARVLAPWFNEALWQLSEGVAIESIDWALVDFGFPQGPFARLDDIGIDVGAGVSRVLNDAFGERMRPPPAMARLLADGRFGRRSGRGFYNYEIRGRERRGAVDGSVYTAVQAWPALTRPATEIAQRSVLAMVNEAAHCLGEGIVRGARDGDVGAVFGVGFPAFLGGPFRYVDALGAAHVVERLESWASLCGDRFRPAPLLTEMANRAGRFYPEED